MPRYIARVYLILDAEDELDAQVAVSGCLTENLMSSGAIVDWNYTKDRMSGRGYTVPVRLVPPADTIDDFREEDVDALFVAARLVHP